MSITDNLGDKKMKKNILRLQDNISVHRTIQQIREGRFDPKTLSKINRQACVEVLFLEGYQEASLAYLFKVVDRTIRRDKEDIRRKNALENNPERVKELIGELLQKARNHHASLKRLSSTQGASVSERAQAEFASWRVEKEVIEKLQSLGYLPSKDAKIISYPLEEIKKDRVKIKEKVDQGWSDEAREIVQDVKNMSPMCREKLIRNLEDRIIEEVEKENSDDGPEAGQMAVN